MAAGEGRSRGLPYRAAGASAGMMRAAWLCVAVAVIAPGRARAAASSTVEQGEMLVVGAGSLLPLRNTTVRARVIGYMARVEVRQTFNNPFKRSLEAIYIFPLAHDASIGATEIRIGDRVIRSKLTSRADARAVYARARRVGRTAALLEQERANVFTQSVANIRPGEEIVVRISYDVQLTRRRGVYEFVYPMVVGPRYIPGAATGKAPKGAGRAQDTDRVPDASRITPPTRKPGSRSGHDVTMDVVIDPGMRIRKLWSPTHKVIVRKGVGGVKTAVRVSLPAAERIPNKDFVVRYRLAKSAPSAAMVVQLNASKPDAKGRGRGYFSLLLEPPVPVSGKDAAAPRELILLVDASASMSGEPMALVKRSIRFMLRHLGAKDSFRIVRFNGKSATLAAAPMDNSPHNVRRALTYINGVRAGGAKEIAAGLMEALRGAPAEGRRRVVFLFTDALVGDGTRCLNVLARDKSIAGGHTRVFAIGVGSATNRALLSGIARVGRGLVETLLPDADVAEVSRDVLRGARGAVLTEIEIDWRGMEVSELSPRLVPDMFVGYAVTIAGVIPHLGPSNVTRVVRVRGRLRGRSVSYDVPVRVAPRTVSSRSGSSAGEIMSGGSGAIARLWARSMIRELASSPARNVDAARAQKSAALAMHHGLMSPYTAFVAVDQHAAGPGGTRKTFVIPVEMPEGVSYEAVFGRLDEDLRNRPFDADPGDKDGASKQIAPSYATGADGDSDDGTMTQTLSPEPGSVITRVSGTAGLARWNLSAGFAAGFGEQRAQRTGASVLLDVALARGVWPHVMLGAEAALLVPRFDTASGDGWVANVMLQLRYAALLRGKLQLVLGAGGSLSGGTEFGLSYMGALDMQVWRASFADISARLRFDGAGQSSDPDLRSYTLGLQLSF